MYISKRLIKLGLSIALATLATASAQAQGTDESRGAELYGSICSSCHGVDGQGVVGAFPPLAGHIQDLLTADGGGEHLARVLMHGIEGPIDAMGAPYNGLMPSWSNRSDEDLAAIYNYIVSAWPSDDQPEVEIGTVDAQYMADIRSNELTPSEVHELRPILATSLSSDSDSEGTTASMDDPGYFTASQVSSGSSLYQSNCAACHGSDLNGDVNTPPLTTDFFMGYWTGKTVSELYGYAANNMPPGNAGSLSTQQYMDIVAFILSKNGHEAGDIPMDEAHIGRLQQLIIGAE